MAEYIVLAKTHWADFVDHFVSQNKKLNLSSYRSIVTGLLVTIAFVCWSPSIIPERSWDQASEFIYKNLLSIHNSARNLLSSEKLAEQNEILRSKIVFIDVDSNTRDQLGWPISRDHYVQLLEKLQSNLGHPHLLSYLSFQPLAENQSRLLAGIDGEKTDRKLAAAIKDYGRYVGSSLYFKNGEELSSEQEALVISKAAISNDFHPEALPYLSATLTEGSEFIQAQSQFGFPLRLPPEALVACGQSLISISSANQSLHIPAALTWGAAMLLNKNLAVAGRGSSTTNNLAISHQFCLPQPALATSSYIRNNSIKTYSMASVLESDFRQDLSGSVVVLGSTEGMLFQDASGEITHKILLQIRFLSELVKGNLIRRFNDGGAENQTQYLFTALAIAIFFLFFVSPKRTITALALGLTAALLATYYQLTMLNVYVVPIRLIIFCFSAAFLNLVAFIVLKSIQAQCALDFASKLRKICSKANNFNDFRHEIVDFVQAYNRLNLDLQISIIGNYEEMYDVAENPSLAVIFKDRADTAPPAQNFKTAKDGSSNIGSFSQPRVDNSIIMAVNDHRSTYSANIGQIELLSTYDNYHAYLVDQIQNIIQSEIGSAWQRMHASAREKIAAIKGAAEEGRGRILGQFLPGALLKRFDDRSSVDGNLKSVLRPTQKYVALMQADIRGFSKMSESMSPMEMTKLLQSFYSGVIEFAAKQAKVKLIGDCIFLFIEPEDAKEGLSQTDTALEIAAMAHEHLIESPLHTQYGSRFGIAINYGEVVVGNLSAASCIDYTVIGPEVNKVARLEELTKHDKIHKVTGDFGIILSDGAYQNLKKYKSEIDPLNLRNLDLKVRSFETINDIHFTSLERLKFKRSKPPASETSCFKPVAS